MKGAIVAVIGVLICSVMFAVSGFTGEREEQKQGHYFKGYTKEDHMKAFPEGHPAVHTLNKCIWDQESGLYFCQHHRHRGD